MHCSDFWLLNVGANIRTALADQADMKENANAAVGLQTVTCEEDLDRG